MLEEFCDTINPLAKDPEIRVIIVKGEGSVFSAGIDFNSLGEMAGTYLSDAAGGGALIRADIHQGQQWLNRLETIEIPIICAMHGGVFGLGVEVALACDIRIASSKAHFIAHPNIRNFHRIIAHHFGCHRINGN